VGNCPGYLTLCTPLPLFPISDVFTDLDLEESHLRSLLKVFETNYSYQAKVVSFHHKCHSAAEDEEPHTWWGNSRISSVADIKLSHKGTPVPGVLQLISLQHCGDTCPPFYRAVIEAFDLSVAMVALPLPEEPSYAEACDRACVEDISAKRMEHTPTGAGPLPPATEVKARLVKYIARGFRLDRVKLASGLSVSVASKDWGGGLTLPCCGPAAITPADLQGQGTGSAPAGLGWVKFSAKDIVDGSPMEGWARSCHDESERQVLLKGSEGSELQCDAEQEEEGSANEGEGGSTGEPSDCSMSSESLWDSEDSSFHASRGSPSVSSEGSCYTSSNSEESFHSYAASVSSTDSLL